MMMWRKPWILCNRLLQAIETKNCDAAANILNDGLDVDSILIDGKSAICVCVEKGCVEIAHMLIERGCSLSLRTYRGESPLHLAVQQSNYNFVELLLKNRADVTCLNILGQTALHMACERNSLSIAALLINNSKRLYINLPDRDGATPLMYACHFGSISLVRHLLEKGGDVNVVDVRGNSPLLVAVLNNHCSVEMLRIILEAGADVHQVNHTHETALLRTLHLMCLNWVSARDKFYELCLFLMESGSDLNASNLNGQTPLHLALTMKDATLARKLLNSGCATNLCDSMNLVPLHYACRSRTKKLVHLLIDGGADLKSVNWSIFKDALCDSESISLLNYVIERSKTCPTLSDLCRTVIRKNLKNIPKHALMLPIPPMLKKFILLESTISSLHVYN